MFVKKFEADTLEEALKAVKLELGPDAIILKTITNNGIKGAFKKKRIEITAAISEKNYGKKAKVDKVLNDDQKEIFYGKSSNKVKEKIDRYNADKAQDGYGPMGLNKVVNTVTKRSNGLADVTSRTSAIIKSSLDEFLSDDISDSDDDSIDESLFVEKEILSRGKFSDFSPSIDESKNILQKERQKQTQSSLTAYKDNRSEDVESFINKENYQELRNEIRTTQHKLELLEQKILELSQNAQSMHVLDNEPEGIFQLRTTLKTLDVDTEHIRKIIKKATYELSKEELENPDHVFEFALKEMTSSVNTSHPLFSTIQPQSPVVTLLISESSSGQSTMATKIAVLKKDVVLIEFCPNEIDSNMANLATQLFGVHLERLSAFKDIVGTCRKMVELGKSVIIDAKFNHKEKDEAKKFIETLKRGFENVEVLCTLSAIHSEIYNRKILARYKDLLNGVIISHVDLCLNFGALFNVHRSFSNLPLIFFGTGPVVPDDIEGATSERLMVGLFQF